MRHWWYFVGWPHGQITWVGPKWFTGREAFMYQFDLERGNVTPFYRWYYDYSIPDWVYDARTGPEFLASL